MTKKEFARIRNQEDVLLGLGFTLQEAEQLRRISMTLQRWHELECGIGDRDTFYVERENADDTGRPFMVSANTGRRWPIPDRETGARKRLAKIMRAHRDRQTPSWPDGKAVYPNPLSAYIQTDPRGAALYIIRPGDVPEGGDVSACYSRGICVY